MPAPGPVWARAATTSPFQPRRCPTPATMPMRCVSGTLQDLAGQIDGALKPSPCPAWSGASGRGCQSASRSADQPGGLAQGPEEKCGTSRLGGGLGGRGRRWWRRQWRGRSCQSLLAESTRGVGTAWPVGAPNGMPRHCVKHGHADRPFGTRREHEARPMSVRASVARRERAESQPTGGSTALWAVAILLVIQSFAAESGLAACRDGDFGADELRDGRDAAPSARTLLTGPDQRRLAPL